MPIVRLHETARCQAAAAKHHEDRQARALQRTCAHGKKNQFSLFALAIFALYGVAISLYPSLFENAFQGANGKMLVFVGVLSSIFIIIVTFVEAINACRVKSLALPKCAMQVARLLDQLEVTDITTSVQLN